MERHRTPATEKKEFAMDRLMLFSDAVFAIAITLLVIDLKWPELRENVAIRWDRDLGPLTFSFVGFVLSFYFIGRFWAVHLRLFRLVRQYDQGLINRNLLFLFFIVLFPFTASGMFGHLQVDFALPVFVYLGNLVLVSVANLRLCRYIFYSKPYLSVEGEKEHKKYFYLRSLYTTIATMATMGVVVVVALIFPRRIDYIASSVSIAGLFMAIANKRAARFRPVGHF
jgi:uncharacterized membrane protein